MFSNREVLINCSDMSRPSLVELLLLLSNHSHNLKLPEKASRWPEDSDVGQPILCARVTRRHNKMLINDNLPNFDKHLELSIRRRFGRVCSM